MYRNMLPTLTNSKQKSAVFKHYIKKISDMKYALGI